MERNRLMEAHSRPGDGRGRDLSEYGKKPTERGVLTLWRRQREGLVRTWKKPTDRGVLTSWRRQREGLVKTRKETDRELCTHELQTTEGGTCQDTERNRPTEAHSQTGDGKGRDLSGHGKKLTDRGALTNWRRQKRLVRTRKETGRETPTHLLETADGGICQNKKETDQPRRAHLLETAEGRTCH